MLEATPSRTALRVALRRAAHQVVDAEPLVFPDPLATRLLDRAAVEELRRTPAATRKPFSAALRAWVVARARFAEDLLAQTAATHAEVQYVVLGAGLDTFALRNPYAHVRVFEVDHPATQAWKCERLAAAGLTMPSGAQLVPVNFETQSLWEELLRAGLHPATPTVTAWLGVVPYLTAAGFAATCGVLGRLRPGSPVVFDYSQPREALPPVEQLRLDSLSARVAQAGEPFQLFFTPHTVAATLARHALRVVEDLGSRELNARYFAHRRDGLAVRGTGSRLCHAVTTAAADPARAVSVVA